MGATTRATVDSASGEDPGFDDIAVTDLVFTTNRPLSETERLDVGRWLVIFSWWLSSQALNQGGPTLPVPSFETNEALAAYGIEVGMELGTVNPSVSHTDSHVELVGEFGRRP
jgi:hypothetical protein